MPGLWSPEVGDMGRRGVRGTLFALVAMLLLGLTTGSAVGHTVLVGSTPADGDVVPMSSQRLTLVFAEDLAPQVGEVSIVAPDGSGAIVGPLRISGATLEARLALSVPGRHRVDFRVTASDGHPLEGSLAFRVRPASKDAAAEAPSETTAAAPATGPAMDAPVVTSAVAASVESDPGAPSGGWLWALAALLLALGVIGLRRSTAVRSATRGA
ncbi:hypothetical protein GCM10027425_00500 [Alteromonas gracilis]